MSNVIICVLYTAAKGNNRNGRVRGRGRRGRTQLWTHETGQKIWN